MPNLTAAHQAEIRDRDAIDIPAGTGRTAFAADHAHLWAKADS